ncbi:hypothetical protein CA606_18545 [Caulobacter vibrioides]|uniref:Uncharacterized protein n=1 Tax=Caulobacter vibrioides TaxID=155892 RepID=A0A290MQA2_CAUVI|nr:hypothetical protein [Caulobacter vibrioides]ATC34170.1 hypothetical protein CA606_18545 [Caulobacter vibrioides]
MTAPAWPADKGRVLADGFRDTFPTLVQRSDVDAGPAKQRRTTTAASHTVDAVYKMTSAERQWFSGFYFGEAAGGGVWFDWYHPVEQQTVLARFVRDAPPSYEPWKPDWRVSVRLEWRP